VFTGELISPTFILKTASSKGFCICPDENSPKFPLFLAEPHSEY